MPTSFLADLPARMRTAGNRTELSKGFWSISDHSLISFTNFATMVLMARSMRPADFGSFVVVYTLVLFAGMFQSALITRPHNVLAASLRDAEFSEYTAGAAAAQTLLAAGLALIALSAGLIAWLAGWGVHGLLIAAAAAVFCWQMQELVRQIEFTRTEPFQVFIFDIISYGGQFALIVFLWQTDILTGPTGFYALAVTSLASAVYGFWRLRMKPWGPAFKVFGRNWPFSRWLLLETIGGLFSHQLYPLIVASFVGVSGAAAFKAVQNLVAPTHILFNAFQSLVTPRAARAAAQGGRHAMYAVLVPASILGLVVLGVFWLTVSILGKPLLNLLYTEHYEEQSSLVWLFCLSYLMSYVVLAQATALLALEDARALLIGRLASILVTITIGGYCTWSFGISGALIGASLASLAMIVVLAWNLRRSEQREATTRSESSVQFAHAGGD